MYVCGGGVAWEQIGCSGSQCIPVSASSGDWTLEKKQKVVFSFRGGDSGGNVGGATQIPDHWNTRKPDYCSSFSPFFQLMAMICLANYNMD